MKPTVVCLCGSTRFKEAFERAERDEGLAGRIVLTVACFGHLGDLAPEEREKGNPVKDRLDALHLHKIEMADEILVINVGGYVGESTRGEIAHALRHQKPIRWLEPLRPDEQLFMVHVGPTGSVFVKGLDFFLSQGGFDEGWDEWGHAWTPIVGTSIENVRRHDSVEGGWRCKQPRRSARCSVRHQIPRKE